MYCTAHTASYSDTAMQCPNQSEEFITTVHHSHITEYSARCPLYTATVHCTTSRTDRVEYIWAHCSKYCSKTPNRVFPVHNTRASRLNHWIVHILCPMITMLWTLCLWHVWHGVPQAVADGIRTQVPRSRSPSFRPALAIAVRGPLRSSPDFVCVPAFHPMHVNIADLT